MGVGVSISRAMGDNWLTLCLLVPIGFVAGIVNVLAGGGSFLTLPALMATGLPLPLANGTNRIAVVVQGLFATAAYRSSGELDGRLYRKLLPPLLLGALVGAWLATVIPPPSLRRVFAVLFLAMAGVLMLRKQKQARARAPHPLRHVALFFVGVYGGFIQAGVGLWILLSASNLFGESTVRANSVKLPLTLTFTVPALVLFAEAQLVALLPGTLLALGTVLGTFVGVRLSLKGGETLILRAVTLVLLVTGLQLLFVGTEVFVGGRRPGDSRSSSQPSDSSSQPSNSSSQASDSSSRPRK